MIEIPLPHIFASFGIGGVCLIIILLGNAGDTMKHLRFKNDDFYNHWNSVINYNRAILCVCLYVLACFCGVLYFKDAFVNIKPKEEIPNVETTL